MNQLDQLIPELEGADYYHDEEETHWPHRGAIIVSLALLSWAVIGIAAYAVW
jgi:hypothetical protein